MEFILCNFISQQSVLALLALSAVALAQQRNFQEQNYPPANYNFDWAVKNDEYGNNYGHEEERDGDQTRGSYFVDLPDGRRQTVTYYVDGDGGYNAVVTYEGEAVYPPHQQFFNNPNRNFN